MLQERREVFMKIKNSTKLLSHGNIKGRKIALDIIEHGLRAVDSYNLTQKTVRITDEKLYVNNLFYDLSKMGNVYIVGAGKATLPIAQALEDILGKKIKKGIVIVKRGQGRKLKRIKVVEAGHPLPDEAGMEGAKEVVRLAKKAGKGDLVFCIITGGASALMPLPAKGISLDDKRKVTDLLLKCGAVIKEINSVRKHISAIKGGRLAMCIHPAEFINLIVIDEVQGLPWGPTVPDTTTFKDAECVLKKYDLWRRTPISVRKHIENGLADPSLETPKPRDFEGLKFHNIILANNEMACEAMKRRAEELGFSSIVLTTVLEGESREAGVILASIANEIAKNGKPFKPPCALILGGETTVTIKGRAGIGGPSQELVLGFSLKIAGNKRIVTVSLDSDGTDGPTDAAGGIADGYTVKRAREKCIDLHRSLMKHDTYNALKKLGDLIVTGPTGTNVMDLNVIVILP